MEETKNSTRSVPNPILPSRLLDVIGNGSSHEDVIKLVETRSVIQESQTLEWFALNHRWGNSQHLTTTKGTLRGHLEGIPFTTLLRTFQDAVVVARKLIVRYLWIDALCLYVSRYRTKYRRNLRLGPLFSKGLRFYALGLVRGE